MSAAPAIVSVAINLSLAILSLAFLLTVYRVVIGPTLPDRALALDMLTAIAIGFIAVMAVKTVHPLYRYRDLARSRRLSGHGRLCAFHSDTAASKVGPALPSDAAARRVAGAKGRSRKAGP